MDQITFVSELKPEIPPYYQCNYPLVDLHLHRITGRGMVSIIANSEYSGVSVFRVETSEREPNPVKTIREKLFKQEMDLDLFQLSTTSVSSFEEGIAHIRSRIQQNEPVIITGTTYELPYSSDYHNPNYLKPRNTSTLGGAFQIGDHYIAVIGIGSEEVLLYDPIPNKFIGTIPFETLAKFWRGNVDFEVFSQAQGFSRLVNYGIMNVTFAEKYQNQKLDQLAINILNRVNNAFLAGRTRTGPGRIYLSGVALNDYIYEVFTSYYAETGEIPQSLGKCLFDMRWSLYYFRDLLENLKKDFHFPLTDICHDMILVIDLWEQVYKTFLTLVRKRSAVDHTQIQKFIELLEHVIHKEQDFHNQIQKWFSIGDW